MFKRAVTGDGVSEGATEAELCAGGQCVISVTWVMRTRCMSILSSVRCKWEMPNF